MNTHAKIVPEKQPVPMDWLALESRTAPLPFASRSDPETGLADVPAARYASRDYHLKECANLWTRVWQMACHASEIPEVGSYVTYDIARQSWIVMRVAPNEIRAYANACRHRGMALTEGRGRKAALTCPFHGWTWNLDGGLNRISEAWDFPQCKNAGMDLPQAQVAEWGGFVFINPDLEAAPFAEHIGNLTAHFAADPLEERKVAFHVARVVPVNWKVAQEAFMESYHVSPTHPQSVPVSGYAESQIDIWPDLPNSDRLWTVSVAPLSDGMKALPPQDFADWAAEKTWREPIALKPGEIYRNALANQRRAEVSQAKGKSVDHLTDAELLDAIQYAIYPNFLPWYGYGVPIAYRFRPNGDNHDSSIMEVYVLSPRKVADPCPPAPEMAWVPPDEPFTMYPELGRFGPILDQDVANFPRLQKGLEMGLASGQLTTVKLSAYQEARIRHFHQLLEKWVGE